jgi:hypothetical protein
MTCVGRGSASGEHCCWVNGERCAYLVEHADGRRFACGLRLELGSWEAVHADPRYAPIQAEWDRCGIVSCGGWQPAPGECCEEAR